MEKFSKLNENQRTSMINTPSYSKDVCNVVGHLSKGRSARFVKTVSYFLHASHEICCRVEVTGKRVNLGDREELQILCILHFLENQNLLVN